MLSFILHRLFLTFFLLFVISLISFFIVTLTPGSPYPWGEMNPKISPELKEAFRKKFHLDRPLPVQYYLMLHDLFTGKLRSMKDELPVLRKILDRLPASLRLNITAMLFSLSCGTLLGIYGARHAGHWHDLLSSFLAFLLIALPGFWISYLVVIGLVKHVGIPILGTQSYGIDFPNEFSRWLDQTWHLMLPALILSLGALAIQSRYLRASMIETLREHYILTAHAKGLSSSAIFYKHALRNSLRPLITGIGMLLPSLISGTVIIESIFAYPGMGQLGYQAVLERDYPMLVALNFIVAALVLIGNFISDLLYAVVDPRVRLE
ncbi:MAG: ABC transporter permease [Verrucomicrobiae bacterium]|jgi:peptide/nickel transport system permease protein|nr:ABC transporter permease [Verrucomicrobiae bacterium]